MERKGRSKPNVAGERYDSNAIPVESKDYATGIKKDKKIVSKKSKKAKKSSKKKKSKSSVDDYIGLFVFGFLLAIVMAAVSMHMFPYVVKEIRRGLGKLLRNKTVAVIHPVLFGVHKVFHEMFGKIAYR